MPITLMAAMAAAQGAKGIADTIIGTSQRRKGQAEFDKLTSQPIERGAMASEYGRYLDTVMGAAGKAESMGRQALQRGVATAGEAASRTGDASSAMDVALKAARGEEELGLKGAADIASAFQTVGGVKQNLLDAQRIRKEGRQDYMIDMAAASAEAGRQQQMAGIGSLIDAGAYAATQTPDGFLKNMFGGKGGGGASKLTGLIDVPEMGSTMPNTLGKMGAGVLEYEAPSYQGSNLMKLMFGRNGMNMGSVQKTPSGYNHDNGDDLAIVDKNGNDTGMRVEGDEYIINHEQAETLKEAAMSGNKELLMRAALKIFSQPQFQ